MKAAFLYAGVFGDGRQTVENQVRQLRELALAREFAIFRELGAKSGTVDGVITHSNALLGRDGIVVTPSGPFHVRLRFEE